MFLTVKEATDEKCSTLDVSCGSTIGQENGTCEHRSLIFSNCQSTLKLRSITSRWTHSGQQMTDVDEWEILQVPEITADEYKMRCVFRRHHLRLMGVANSVITLDCRLKRMRNGLKSRIKCKICQSQALNVGSCNDEQAVVKYLIIESGVKKIMGDKNVDSDVSSTDRDHFDEAPEQECLKYESGMKRNIFPCHSEKLIIANVLRSIMRVKYDKAPNNNGTFYVGRDKHIACKKCANEWIVRDERENEVYLVDLRKVTLHTLHHRSIRIGVHDFLRECGNVVPYDSRSDGIFCFSRHHACSIELLDAWMYDVCRVGMSFRDAFSS